MYKCIIFVYYINKPASCLFIIYNFSCKKKVIVYLGCFSTIINFLVCTHLVCACSNAVLGSEIESAQLAHLLAASADAGLVHKYFSSTKGRASAAACWHCNTLVLYRTCTILYDTCLMDAECIFHHI